jgi:hypothetical protein
MPNADYECVCTPWGGCDEEGDPGCAYCRELDCELPCPADLADMEQDDA